jgi:hypothetical protein
LNDIEFRRPFGSPRSPCGQLIRQCVAARSQSGDLFNAIQIRPEHPLRLKICEAVSMHFSERIFSAMNAD